MNLCWFYLFHFLQHGAVTRIHCGRHAQDDGRGDCRPAQDPRLCNGGRGQRWEAYVRSRQWDPGLRNERKNDNGQRLLDCKVFITVVQVFDTYRLSKLVAPR